MTAIGRDEAIERLESACECEHAALVEMRAQRDQARDIAARLEAENAALRVLLAGFFEAAAMSRPTLWNREYWAIVRFIETGSLSAESTP